MAEKKASAKKGTGKKKTGSSGKKKTTAAARAVAPKAEVPYRGIFALVCLVCAVLNVFSCAGVDALLLNLLRQGLTGLLGGTGYYFMCAVWIALFWILAFRSGKPVAGRISACLGMVLFTSAISHLSASQAVLPEGIAVVAELYEGGQIGTTGGVFGGLLALFFRFILGKTLAIATLCILLLLSLLWMLGITVPGLVRAVQNRPRPEPEPEEERIDPASAVVNHIATRHIERVEQKRQRRREMALFDPDEDPQAPLFLPKESKKSKAQSPDEYIMEERKKRETILEPEEEENEIFAPAPAVFPDPVEAESPLEERMEPVEEEIEPVEEEIEPVGEKVSAKDARQSAIEVAKEISQNETQPPAEYQFPPLTLLKAAPEGGLDGTEEMRENARRLSETLQSFKISATICNVTRGPTVTRYEVELERGVRLSKITSLADDIALNLGAIGVRIAAIPDKISVVGIEVPNKLVTTVSLRDVIASSQFARAQSRASFAVGKDISGTCVVGDISKLPHMLIAGTTGSGKSVCINSLLISILYKAKPQEVKFIMVDPKLVELGIYNGIPHLLIPVVTDPKKAAGALQWAVTEMMRRYKTMADAGVRDIEAFNQIMENSEEGEKLAKIVVVIDELADLMLVAAKEVEESICRVAQMGRAAGIHLVIATQRPSADVITGLMKANIPSRIAFAVSSAMESRIILDTMGAEKLVGRGDMLYAPLGKGKPRRIQGCFVSDGEVEAVTEFIKESFSPSYSEDVMEEIERKATQTGKGNAGAVMEENEDVEGDELLPDAVDVILETGQASVSMLQRRLKLGYARAARIVDEMEEKGIVGPHAGAKSRAILVTKEQWRQMQSGQMGVEETPALDPVPEELP